MMLINCQGSVQSLVKVSINTTKDAKAANPAPSRAQTYNLKHLEHWPKPQTKMPFAVTNFLII
jgi:hypothetical protein